MVFEKKFFEEEERDGFLVPELMKRAWAAEMEVLEVVAGICDKHGITYFADWGTLLGAVRHKGFIPWDDDIDIALKRPDYNRLISLLRSELPEGFVLTGMYAEDERLQEAAYTHQMRVMADEECWDLNSYMRRFHSFPFYRVGIDIYPLDYVHRDTDISDLQKMILQQIMRLLVRKGKDFTEEAYEKQLQYVEELCGVSLVRDDSLNNQLWKLFDSIRALYTYDESDHIAGYTSWIINPDCIYKKEWYDTFVMMPFENTMIPAPEKYHQVLTAMFGDYKIPVRDDASHAYPCYKNQEQKFRKTLQERGIAQNVEEFCRNFAEKYNCN